MQHIRLAALLSLVLATTSVLAQEPAPAGDPKHGAVLADTCMGCHGIAGYRNAYPSYRVPKLGGQQTDYIVIALQGYKNQTRPHKTMHAQAVTQSDQDMRDIAAFFASEGAIQKAASPHRHRTSQGRHLRGVPRRRRHQRRRRTGPPSPASTRTTSSPRHR